MLGPAGQLILIESGKSYNDKKLIFSIHCTRTNECEVIVKPQGSDEVIFPIGSFIRGAVYHIFIEYIIFDKTKTSFIGYRLM